MQLQTNYIEKPVLHTLRGTAPAYSGYSHYEEYTAV